MTSWRVGECERSEEGDVRLVVLFHVTNTS